MTFTMMDGTSTATRGAVDWRSVATYLLLTFALAWAAFIGLRAVGVPFTIRAAIGMFAPAASAVLTRSIRREGFRDAGFRLGPSGAPDLTYLWAYVVPILLIVLGVVLSLTIGGHHWALEQNFQRVVSAQLQQARTGLQTTSSLARTLLIVQVGSALTVNVAINCLFTFGEELGWRGHLLPRLAPLGGLAAAVLTGFVWGLWHAPLIGLDGYEYGTPSWVLAPYFCLFTVPFGVIQAWLRFRSDSIWPCVLAHAAANSVATIALLALSTPLHRLIDEPVGLLGVLPFWLFAIWLAATGKVGPRPASITATGAPAPTSAT